MTGDYKVRYERFNEWVYPGFLSFREQKELMDRNEKYYVMGEALAQIAGKRPRNPERRFLKDLYDSLIEFPWVGRYRVIEDMSGYSYTIFVQTIGNYVVSYRVSGQSLLDTRINLGQEVGKYLNHLFIEQVRKEFPEPVEKEEEG